MVDSDDGGLNHLAAAVIHNLVLGNGAYFPSLLSSVAVCRVDSSYKISPRTRSLSTEPSRHLSMRLRVRTTRIYNSLSGSSRF